ncbi:MAG: hypothetical protein K0Q60_2128 [Microvirga sp.]|jgi:hypothetical protein|nr:hypothetical protein [Microvirga sp.]
MGRAATPIHGYTRNEAGVAMTAVGRKRNGGFRDLNGWKLPFPTLLSVIFPGNWKALIRTYIGTIPSKGEAPCGDEQRMSERQLSGAP